MHLCRALYNSELKDVQVYTAVDITETAAAAVAAAAGGFQHVIIRLPADGTSPSNRVVFAFTILS